MAGRPPLRRNESVIFRDSVASARRCEGALARAGGSRFSDGGRRRPLDPVRASGRVGGNERSRSDFRTSGVGISGVVHPDCELHIVRARSSQHAAAAAPRHGPHRHGLRRDGAGQRRCRLERYLAPHRPRGPHSANRCARPGHRCSARLAGVLQRRRVRHGANGHSGCCAAGSLVPGVLQSAVPGTVAGDLSDGDERCAAGVGLRVGLLPRELGRAELLRALCPRLLLLSRVPRHARSLVRGRYRGVRGPCRHCGCARRPPRTRGHLPSTCR